MDQGVYRCGNCQLNAGDRRFTRGDQEIVLEPKVFAVLVQLLMRPGELLTRDQLLDSVWGHRYVTASTLNRVIALARRAFADDADRPKFIQTVHGAGYRYVGPIEHSNPVSTGPRARFGPPISARLPARLQTLVGRQRELLSINEMLAERRALTILGTGGMGKTQCAIVFAHQQMSDYPDGVWFFDLAPMQQAIEWLQTLALSLSIAPCGERELLEKIIQALRGRRALLLLDNCDRLSVDVGALVVAILRATDQIRVLATSRQSLKYLGERVLRMPPLLLPTVTNPGSEAELKEVAAAPAVSLLLARIRDTQPEFSLTAANASDIASICSRLDGMPLALELAAARFALLAPDQVLERLDQRFRFLVSDRSGRDQRHRNLLALLDWSFRLLSPEEQRFLTWLGVFVQGWTVDAAIDVANAFGATPETAVDLLTGLADKSLVAVDQTHSPPRYRLLETVREFAMTHLRSSGDEHLARDAHLGHILRMSEAAHQDMVGGRMRQRLDLLIRDHENIVSATDHALGAANLRPAAQRIAGLLTPFFWASGDTMLAKRLCNRALDEQQPQRTRERGMALMAKGVADITSDRETTACALKEAVSIAREVGDDWTVAYASGTLALWLSHMGRLGEIAEHLAVVERIAEARDDGTLRGLAGWARGWAYMAEDANEQAIFALQSIRVHGNDSLSHQFMMTYIALALFRLGEHAAAASQWLKTMETTLAVGNFRGMSGTIEGCGYIAERLGKTTEACRLLGAAEKIRKRLELPLFSFWHRHNQAAHSALQARLGVDRYGEAVNEGVRMREEDAVNEAAVLLRCFAAGTASAF